MDAIICKAIQEARVLGFTYRNVQRWVEPHTYGRQFNGKDGVCAWQLAGGSGEGFRLFLVSDITNLSVGDVFDGPRPDYHRGDQRFQTIFAEL